MPEAIVSSSSRPGVRRCTCGSTNAGAMMRERRASRARFGAITPSVDRDGDAVAAQRDGPRRRGSRSGRSCSRAHAATASTGSRDSVASRSWRTAMRTTDSCPHLLEDQRLRRIGDQAVDLDATVDRARVHDLLARGDPLGVIAPARRVLAEARHVGRLHPLPLHPQHVRRSRQWSMAAMSVAIVQPSASVRRGVAATAGRRAATCAPTRRSAWTSERATREWRTSPTIATCRPSSRRRPRASCRGRAAPESGAGACRRRR